MTEPDASGFTSLTEDLEALGRARRRPTGWLRRNAWAPLGAVAIMVVLVAATQLVLAVAGRKDDLRQAQIAVAAAGQTEFALMHAPIGLIAGQAANPDEYTLNATLRAKLTGQMARLARYWPSPLSRQVSAEATALANRTVVLYDLIRQRQLRAAGKLYDRSISPLSDEFNAKLAQAQNRLGADTSGADHRALVAALGVASAAGVLLVLLFLSILGVRRRLENADTVQRVLSTLATTDSLTGVPNHRALILTIRTELERARRYQRPFALLFLDVDHFKQINDHHGHSAGDTVLADFATVVNNTLRSSDAFGRWGGEEFLAVLPETDLGSATETAERIRTAIEQHDFIPGERVTCSIGIAICPDDGSAFDSLIAAADQAMYCAKAAGRNQCATFAGTLAA
jgi:diguanylate cyclase (GGDEF)-like protein